MAMTKRHQSLFSARRARGGVLFIRFRRMRRALNSIRIWISQGLLGVDDEPSILLVLHPSTERSMSSEWAHRICWTGSRDRNRRERHWRLVWLLGVCESICAMARHRRCRRVCAWKACGLHSRIVCCAKRTRFHFVDNMPMAAWWQITKWSWTRNINLVSCTNTPFGNLGANLTSSKYYLSCKI